MRWDQCPKMMTLPRSDCAICFAGDTEYAYPLMIQLYYAIDSYSRSRQRAMDLHDLRGHVLNVFNHLQKSVFMTADRADLKRTEFLFVGYSWIRKQFSLWRFHYVTSEDRFQYVPSKRLGPFGEIIYAGDWARAARLRLGELLRSRYGKRFERYTGSGFDLEPFEVLRDILRAQASDSAGTVGGPPQIVKVYQHLNCRPVGVYWPTKASGQATVMGRHILGYESPEYWVMDPDTFITKQHVSLNAQQEQTDQGFKKRIRP